MKKLIFIFFLSMMQFYANSQLSKFNELSHKMFFNIFIHEPDSSVFDFVKKYFPAFTEKYEPGGWTIYPPGPPPQLQHTVHSLKFTSHPYFNAKFREGRLDIFSSEEKDGKPGVTDFKLWFMFDNKEDGVTAFKQLSLMFDTLSQSKNIYKKNKRSIAEYSNQPVLKSTNSVQLILTPDELLDKKYKLFFRIGSFTYLE